MGGEDLRTALRALNALGYRLDVAQVTAERFTPQSRPRVFVLGLREDVVGGAMTLPEEVEPEEWMRAVNSGGDVRPPTVRAMMLHSPEQTSLLDEEAEKERFLWGVVPFPEPPPREEDFIDLVDWNDESWWEPERTARALSEMNPLHEARVREMQEASVESPKVATAYRRRRDGRSVYEVRADGVAGCLRTARGGSSTQLVIVAEDGEVRMRRMSPREYARLQGAEYQEALDAFSGGDLRTAFGDAVCVPAVSWVAEHAFGEVADFPEPVEAAVAGGPE